MVSKTSCHDLPYKIAPPTNEPKIENPINKTVSFNKHDQAQGKYFSAPGSTEHEFEAANGKEHCDKSYADHQSKVL